LENDRYSIVDNETANSTFVNGKKLIGKTAVALHIGDKISFGSIQFEFVDAKTLYQILRDAI
jgi:pSer/pThr/pTyr-binding forkhead associated (FHA) protein